MNEVVDSQGVSINVTLMQRDALSHYECEGTILTYFVSENISKEVGHFSATICTSQPHEHILPMNVDVTEKNDRSSLFLLHDFYLKEQYASLNIREYAMQKIQQYCSFFHIQSFKDMSTTISIK